MRLDRLILAAFVGALSGLTFALTPVPQRTMSDRVCNANHIFVGTVVAYREQDECQKHPGQINSDWCHYLQADVQVQEVLWPATWRPPGLVAYRNLATKSLHQTSTEERSIVEGQKMIFIAIERLEFGQVVFRSSASGQMPEPLGALEEVKNLVKSCHGKDT